MQLTISGYSTALFSTFYLVEELGLLFDGGDGICAHLLSKARKASHAFMSHADRDHVAGLLQFNQLNGREGLTIYYPRDCGSFPRLADFCKKFDPQTTGTAWKPLVTGDIQPIRSDVHVLCMRNEHVPAPPDLAKSLSYKVIQTRRKLRPEFVGMPGAEIGRIRAEKGNAAVTVEQQECLMAYSGDTPTEYDGRWEDTGVLIHEATFLRDADLSGNHGNKHSSLEGVMRMVAESNIQSLILGHFSSRYDIRDIDKSIQKYIREFGIKIPVRRIAPQAFTYDLLSQPAFSFD